jgi:RNA-binding protein YlmH
MNASDDDKLFLARAQDAIRLSEQNGAAKYLGFLDMHKRQIVQTLLDGLQFKKYCYYGGYEQAERVYIGFFPEYEEPQISDFPICAADISWKFEKLNHRDFLGSILSLGIERDKIGDIIIHNENCIVFADSVVCSFVVQNLIKVGGTGVHCEAYCGGSVYKDQQFKEIRSTIASNRLDCIVAAICNEARSEAERLISSGKVSVDFRQAVQATQKVNEGSTISVRHYGRFDVVQIGPANRKGRFVFLANKYL